jgi:hypothetical protein
MLIKSIPCVSSEKSESRSAGLGTAAAMTTRAARRMMTAFIFLARTFLKLNENLQSIDIPKRSQMSIEISKTGLTIHSKQILCI